jgi:hypothetical protein
LFALFLFQSSVHLIIRQLHFQHTLSSSHLLKWESSAYRHKKLLFSQKQSREAKGIERRMGGGCIDPHFLDLDTSWRCC